MKTGCLSKFDVLSLNVRGIRDQIKRSIFSYLKDQKANIYFLQETYSERADENISRNEWGGVPGRFAYKSIRLHRGRFAYTTEVVSPTRSESIRLH